MSEKKARKQNNIILFPGLVTKLLDKGMKTLKEKSYGESLSYFTQALELEPDHPQARFGIVLCYMELDRVEDAIDESEDMLKKDIGDYYEVLQVHISLLVQQGRYEQVVSMLEAVLSEDKLPAHYAETFYQFLHFSRKMAEDNITVEEETNELEIDEAISLLQHSDAEKQWRGIQDLRKLRSDKGNEALAAFVENMNNDKLLQTYALQTLKEKNVRQKIKVCKLGRCLDITPYSLVDPDQSTIVAAVISILETQLESENPTMLHIAKEIWWQYVFAIYPFEPLPTEERLLAASIYIVALDSHGMEFDESEIAMMYQVDLKEMLHKANEITTVLEEVFQTPKG